eukprot:scaffold4716_cov109-Isochrysis_galbana.AAC.16
MISSQKRTPECSHCATRCALQATPCRWLTGGFSSYPRPPYPPPPPPNPCTHLPPVHSTLARCPTLFQVAEEVDWVHVQARAAARGETDCPVCLSPVGGCPPLCQPCDDTGGGPAEGRNERLALLSCSHVFHERCVAAFEAFALSPAARTCPVCRSQYTKLALAPAVGRDQSGSVPAGGRGSSACGSTGGRGGRRGEGSGRGAARAAAERTAAEAAAARGRAAHAPRRAIPGVAFT